MFAELWAVGLSWNRRPALVAGTRVTTADGIFGDVVVLNEIVDQKKKKKKLGSTAKLDFSLASSSSRSKQPFFLLFSLRGYDMWGTPLKAVKRG